MAERSDDNWFRHMRPRDEELLYRRALSFVQESGSISISRLQRELQIGFYQAERLIERVRRRLLN